MKTNSCCSTTFGTQHASTCDNYEKPWTHRHHGITYAVNAEGRCEWHNCTYNVYNSFDEPEDDDD